MAKNKIANYAPANIKDVFNKAKSLTANAIAGFDYRVNSSGTVNESLEYNIDPATGFWEENVGSKPPRWLLHVDRGTGAINVDYARHSDGREFATSGQVGYLNNHSGQCAVFMNRIRAVFKKQDGTFEHFDDWEWLLVLAFNRPLARGTSGERLTHFDPKKRSIRYQSEEYDIVFVGIITTPNATSEREIDGTRVTYEQMSDAIRTFLEPDSESNPNTADIPAAALSESIASSSTTSAQQELEL